MSFNEFRLLEKEWGIRISDEMGISAFCVIMKGNQIITNFKRPIYQTLDWTKLIWKWCKNLKILKSCIGRFVICLKCVILIIDAWKEYIKKSDGMVILFLYSEFNVKM